MKKKEIGVIIPVYNEEDYINKTLNSLIKSFLKFGKNYTILVVDDASVDNTFNVVSEYTKKYDFIRAVRNESNLGPARSRNLAVKYMDCHFLAFVDSDCVVKSDWIENVNRTILKNKVVMGNVKIRKSNFLGDSISALGFPGGGSVGFEKIWKVDKWGYTDHISSCNFVAERNIFFKYGMFDESFPLAGGEDTELAIRWRKQGVKIYFDKGLVVYHRPRKDLISFSRWMYARGRSNYYLKKRIGEVSDLIVLRFWSTKNVIVKNFFSFKFPFIFFLLILSFVLQQVGFYREKWKNDQ